MRPTELTDASLATVAGDLVGVRVPVGAGPRGTPIELDVYDAGPADAEVVLLVAGLGMQRTSWPPQLLEALLAAGYRTIAVDNRDAGRSTILPGTLVDLPVGADGWPEPAYPLTDMARDLAAVLAHLDVDRAHVIGISMGGMIAQRLANDRPELVRSLTSLMSTTGARGVGAAHESARFVLTAPAPTEREPYLDHAVAVALAIGSPGQVDPVRARAVAEVSYARGVYPQGTARQLLAIRADGDRTPALATIMAPTLVVHGDADPLIDVSGGRATAAAVAGAHLHVVDGLGHDLAPGLLDQVVPVIIEHLAAHPAVGPVGWSVRARVP
jgi:pimeloyl-ACP methyl ester carboxylesterase